MNTFEMFLRLPLAEQRRIVRASKLIARVSRGAYDMVATADHLTNVASQARAHIADARAEQRRANFR